MCQLWFVEAARSFKTARFEKLKPPGGGWTPGSQRSGNRAFESAGNHYGTMMGFDGNRHDSRNNAHVIV